MVVLYKTPKSNSRLFFTSSSSSSGITASQRKVAAVIGLCGLETRTDWMAEIDTWPVKNSVSSQYTRRGESKLTPNLGEPIDHHDTEAIAQAGKALGVSHGQVSKADFVFKHGTPELVAAVDAGKLNVYRAEQIAEEPSDRGRRFLQDSWQKALSGPVQVGNMTLSK
jgi:hypothetical protein